jgi:DNA-binding PadR family transcriptional regulator
MGTNKFLGEFEQMVLLAILHLEDGAYGRAIRQELQSRANRTVTHGASYITLDRMVSKGLLESELREPDPGRGGRARRYFRVTPAGVQALRESRAALQNLWSGLEAILEET